MNHQIKIIPTLAGFGLAVGIGALSVEAAGVPSGAYALMKRLILKGGEAAADEAARVAINTGALHEEYELTSTGFSYWDQFWGTYRSQPMPYKYRRVWLDPVTYTQHFETYTNMVLESRYPFYYVMHNRNFHCSSSGDLANGYDYSIRAEASYLLKDRVIKAERGHEILQHPVTYAFGLTSLPTTCYDPHFPLEYEEKGSLSIARASDAGIKSKARNADVRHLIAVYAP